jgi:flagellar basal-body rod protein FlgB
MKTVPSCCLCRHSRVSRKKWSALDKVFILKFGEFWTFSMIPTSVMALAEMKANWLSARQQVLAENIANANTPGYKSRDLISFAKAIQNIASTSDTKGTGHGSPTLLKVEDVRIGETAPSGNTVSIDTELAKIGEATSQYSLNTNIIKSFHRMLTASLKG